MPRQYFRATFVKRDVGGEPTWTVPFDNRGGPKNEVVWGVVAIDHATHEAIIKVEDHTGTLDYVTGSENIADVTETEVEDFYERIHGERPTFAEIDDGRVMGGI